MIFAENTMKDQVLTRYALKKKNRVFVLGCDILFARGGTEARFDLSKFIQLEKYISTFFIDAFYECISAGKKI